MCFTCAVLQCKTGCIWPCVGSMAGSWVPGYRQPALWSSHPASLARPGRPRASLRLRVTSSSPHVTSGQFSGSAEPKTETLAFRANLLPNSLTSCGNHSFVLGDAEITRDRFFLGAPLRSAPGSLLFISNLSDVRPIDDPRGFPDHSLVIADLILFRNLSLKRKQDFPLTSNRFNSPFRFSLIESKSQLRCIHYQKKRGGGYSFFPSLFVPFIPIL